MSHKSLGEMTPIIIKGKTCPSAIAGRSCFDISADQQFRIDGNAPGSREWVTSTTVSPTGGIDSILIGEIGMPFNQYCKTSNFKRPLTVEFKARDNQDKEYTLFTIRETEADDPEKSDANQYYLTISAVQDTDTYFITTPSSASALAETDWEESEGFSKNITAVIVIDSSTGGDIACCRLVPQGEKIIIDVLQPVY